jgi:poly(3-hydroxybutyrate) depolymerase
MSLAAALSLSTSMNALAQPGQGRTWVSDPRAEDRNYLFADTNEDVPYCVFASSKISDDTPAPLIISLHGLGAPPQIMCNSTAVDLAEEGGYILAAPMGYNTGGWYGSPTLSPAGRGGNNAAASLDFDAIDQADDDGNSDDQLTIDEVGAFFGNGPAGNNGPAANGPGGGFAATAFGRWDANDDGIVTRQEFDDRPQFGGGGGFGGGNQPENLAELSEKDVMNVLEMTLEEFNVDENRIYLTGHSMGGAGTLFLGSKHADVWAAVAPVAPAAFSMTESRADILQGLKDGGVPVMLVHGDEDEAVPVDLARTWVATMEELGMEHEYVELPGVTHGPVITVSQEHIYEFFGKHSK